MRVEDGRWRAPGGVEIVYRLVAPAQPRELVVLLHGFAEHGGRHLPLAEWLAGQGLAVALPDLPGHGRSGGAPGDFGSLPEGAQALARLTREVWLTRLGLSRYSLIGHSFGGLLVIEWLRRADAPVRRAIVQCPLLEVAFPIPRWKRSAGALLGLIWPSARLPTGLDPSLLSYDPDVVEAYCCDPLVHHWMSARTYRSTFATRDAAFAHAESLRTPVLLLCAGDDGVVSTPAAQEWYARVGGPKRMQVYPGCRHELHHEPVRDDVRREMLEWLRA